MAIYPGFVSQGAKEEAAVELDRRQKASRGRRNETWTRPCLKCGTTVTIPKTRRMCDTCFLENMNEEVGIYGAYGPLTRGEADELHRAVRRVDRPHVFSVY